MWAVGGGWISGGGGIEWVGPTVWLLLLHKYSKLLHDCRLAKNVQQRKTRRWWGGLGGWEVGKWVAWRSAVMSGFSGEVG